MTPLRFFKGAEHYFGKSAPTELAKRNRGSFKQR